MSITRLAHIAFQVRNLDETLRYYCDGLGLREHFRISFGELREMMDQDGREGRPHAADDRLRAYIDRHLDDPWIVYLEVAPLQYIEIFPAIEPESLGDPLGADSHNHLCLEVDDAQATWEGLVARGFRTDGPPRTGPDNSVQFWLTDPDGHRIELMQYTPTSLQRIGRPSS